MDADIDAEIAHTPESIFTFSATISAAMFNICTILADRLLYTWDKYHICYNICRQLILFLFLSKPSSSGLLYGSSTHCIECACEAYLSGRQEPFCLNNSPSHKMVTCFITQYIIHATQTRSRSFYHTALVTHHLIFFGTKGLVGFVLRTL